MSGDILNAGLSGRHQEGSPGRGGGGTQRTSRHLVSTQLTSKGEGEGKVFGDNPAPSALDGAWPVHCPLRRYIIPSMHWESLTQCPGVTSPLTRQTDPKESEGFTVRARMDPPSEEEHP